MRFGWFDFIDDLNVSKALLNQVEDIGRSHDLEYIEGPVGFSNLDKVGVITDGFDAIGSMISWYNYAYYSEHYYKANYSVEKSYVESKFPFKNITNIDHYSRLKDIIQKRYNLSLLNAKKTKDIMPHVDAMFDLFNNSYASLSSFVPISDSQKIHIKKKFISFINPEYIKLVFDKDHNMVAFAVVMPVFAEALQKMKGQLFPFGFRHILKVKKQPKNVMFYLIGVDPKYQNKGVHAIIFDAYHKEFKLQDIQTCYRSAELEDNLKIQRVWKHFNPTVFRKRKTFKKIL